MQADLRHQEDGCSRQRNDEEGVDASIDDGGGSGSGSGRRYQTALGPGKWTVMQFCGICKYNKRLVMIEEAFVELEKYVDASDKHNTNLPNMPHLSTSQEDIVDL